MTAKRAADRASEPQASIAQSKRIGACHPQRQVHAVLARQFHVLFVLFFAHSICFANEENTYILILMTRKNILELSKDLGFRC